MDDSRLFGEIPHLSQAENINKSQHFWVRESGEPVVTLLFSKFSNDL